jgi:hypothetical protein
MRRTTPGFLSPHNGAGWWRIARRTTLAHALALGTLCGISAAGMAQENWEFEVPELEGLRWFKGNTHTHTTESDGDSPPETVARWYKEHGYAFLVLSDHNVFTDPQALAHLVDSTFLLIPGEELTSGYQGKAVHVNGLNIPGVVMPRVAEGLAETIQANVDAVREVDGVPHINHPNFGWSFGADELARVEGDRLLEIFNGHPSVHSEGGGGHPSVEEIWDVLLTGGKRIYGIAVDDAHHFLGEFSPQRSNPGRGWVAVLAESLDARELMESLERGLFYASTGIVVERLNIERDRLEVTIQPRGDFRYTTEFIGPGGTILKRAHGNRVSFTLGETAGGPLSYLLESAAGRGLAEGPLPYVRARIRDSGGARAWIQPVFLHAGEQ